MKTEKTHHNIPHRDKSASLKQAPNEPSGKDCAYEDEKRCHRLLELMEDAYFETDLEGTLCFFTDSFCELLGYRPKKLEPVSLSACFSPDDKKKVAAACEKVLKTQKPSPKFDCTIGKLNGLPTVTEITLSLILDSTGQAEGFSGIARDVTEKLALKTALKESEEKYQNILESAPYSISIFSASDGRYVQVSNGFCDYTGYSVEETIGRTARELNLHLSKNDAERVAQRLRQDHKLDSLEMSYRAKDGSIIDTLVSARPIRFKGKTCYLSVAADITPIKTAQKALKESEARYRAILNAAMDPICLTRMSDGKYVEANNAFYQRTGYTPEETIGHTSSEINLYADPADRERLVAEINKNGQVDGIEMPIRLKDGTIARDLWSCRILQFDNEPHLVVVAKDISELKKSQKAAEEKEERYRTILNSAPYGIVITRLSDAKYIEVNDAACHRTGFSREETIGRTPVELDIYADLAQRDQMFKILREKGQIDGLEVSFKRKDGTIQESMISTRPIQYGDEDCLLTITMDISTLKEYQQALKESEESYRTILDSAPYSIVVTRLSDARYLQVNEAFCRRTGYRREEAIGRTPQELNIFIEPAQQKRIRKMFDKNGRVDSMEISFRGKDGRMLHNLYSATPITYKGEDCMLSLTVSLEELKKTQQALRESEQKYRNILTNIEEGYWEVDLSGTFTFVNEAEARMHRCSSQDLIGKNNRGFTDPQKAKEIYKVFNQIYTSGIPVKVFDYELLREDGSIANVEVSASPLRDASGKTVGFFGMSRNVTEKKKAEERIRESEKRFRTIFESAQDAIYIKDSKLNYTLVNPVMERLYGFKAKNFIGRTDEQIFGDKYSALAKDSELRVLKGEIIEEEELRLIDGQKRTFHSIKVPLDAGSGTITGLCGFGRDLTATKQLEAQLQQAQKMEAIGILAGGVSHDFNNLLQAVLGYTQILLNDRDPHHTDYKKIKGIEKAALRAADLTRQLLTFSRKVEINPRPLDLNHVVKQVEALLKRTIPKMIAIDLRLTKPIHTVNADAGQLEQVLLNIGLNSKDSMPDGGKLIFETSNVNPDDSFRKVNLNNDAGPYVLMSITDTGQGMSEEILEHIFEPFFTTKEAGKGTGLGLAIAYGIIKNHQGHLACSSKINVGTTFDIYLPAIDAVTIEETTRPDEPILKGNNETILIIDDEPYLRDFAIEMLSENGYRILTADSGEEGLRVYRQNKESIDLIILDLIMPGMGGKQCMAEIMISDPNAKILISSGYTMDDPKKDKILINARGFVGKPYNISEMLRVIREVIEARE